MSYFFRTQRLSLSVACAFLAVACSEPEPIIVNGLTLSQTSVVFNYKGGESVVLVTPFPENEEWSLSAQLPEWATAEAQSDGVRVVAQANLSPEVRTASFSLLSPKNNFEPYEITISQEAGPNAEFSTSAAESYTFDSEGGEFRFTVFTTAEWSVECESEWLGVDYDCQSGIVVLSAAENQGEEFLSAVCTLSYNLNGEEKSIAIEVGQDIRANNPYYKLVGQWEIRATKWFYSPNGSLNSLDYAPSPTDHYLIFDIAEGEYGKTLLMQNFLYPGTQLEVRYLDESGSFIIPFGWTVLSHDVFLYITLVNDRQFSYASLEVEASLNEEEQKIELAMPTVDGFNWVGFGLWTYNDDGNKIALGSNYRPTIFPMGNITFHKQSN